MLLEINNLSFSYGSNVIFDKASLRLNRGEKATLTGFNGSGKTTLLKLLTGELSIDSGDIVFAENTLPGYLSQVSEFSLTKSIFDEVKTVGGAERLLTRMKQLEQNMANDPDMLEEYQEVSARYEAIDGYNLDYTIKRVLKGMGFEQNEWDKPAGVLSGGEKTRLSLAKLLVLNPDLLILDEPTNHLDLVTIEWLEQYLCSYKGSVLLVSHDRKFLDNVCKKTFEVIGQKIETYSGNFSKYLVLSKQKNDREKELLRRNQKKAEEFQQYYEKNITRASTSNMAKSRLKMKARLNLDEVENTDHQKITFEVVPATEPYKEVLSLKDVSIKAGNNVLVEGITETVLRGERLVIAGANGTGKTTLLKTILRELLPFSGRIVLGGGVKPGYLAQIPKTTETDSPFDFIRGRYPTMPQLEIRSLLAAVGFRGEDVFKSGTGLSGGERARLEFCRLSVEKPNLLILDEPTNHLDIYTKDVVCSALSDYKGTLVTVTHDRYLMEALSAKIMYLADKKAQVFENYAQFESYLKAVKSENLNETQKSETEQQINVSSNSKEQRKERAQKRNRISFLETEIEKLETETSDIEKDINSQETSQDIEKLTFLCEQLEQKKKQLSDYSEEWITLCD